MRAAWWLLKLGWRAATRVRRYFGDGELVGSHPTEWVMGGPLYPEDEDASPNVSHYSAPAPELEHPAVEREARELADKLARGGRR
jgi:hypothetical protein